MRRFALGPFNLRTLQLRLDRAIPIEGKRDRAGIVLAAPGAAIGKYPSLADVPAPPVDLSLEEKLSAAKPLTDRPIDNILKLALTGSTTDGVNTVISGLDLGPGDELERRKAEQRIDEKLGSIDHRMR